MSGQAPRAAYRPFCEGNPPGPIGHAPGDSRARHGADSTERSTGTGSPSRYLASGSTDCRAIGPSALGYRKVQTTAR
jgi:hypothetical protein